jgi:hypothetical protein
MVPLLDARSSRRHSLLHRQSALGIHIPPVNGLLFGTLRALFDLAECHGLVRARERTCQVLFVEPYCEDMTDSLLEDDFFLPSFLFSSLLSLVNTRVILTITYKTNFSHVFYLIYTLLSYLYSAVQEISQATNFFID